MEHEGAFANYHGHWPDAWQRRIRSSHRVTSRKPNRPPAAQSQTNQNPSAPAPSSNSSEFGAVSQNAAATSSDKSSATTSQSAPNTADTNSQAQSNQTSPPSQGQSTNNAATAQRRDGSFAGSIYPAAERALSGADQHGAADQQSDPGVAYRLQHEYQCGDSAIYQYQYRGSAVEHPIQRCAVEFIQCQRLGLSQSDPAHPR